MRQIHAQYRSLLALVMLVLVAGCQGVSLETPEERIGAAFAGIESAADLAATLYEAEVIDDAQRAEVADRLQQALDLAREARRLNDRGVLDDETSTLTRAIEITRSVTRLLQRYEDDGPSSDR